MAKRKTSKAKASRRVKRARVPKASRDVLSGVEPEQWRARVVRMAFPRAGLLPDDVDAMVDANAIAVAEDVLSRPNHYAVGSVRKTKRGEVVMVQDDFVRAIQHAARAGFYLAVRVHQRELEVVPDAATVVRSQKSGLTNSLTKRSNQKQERIATARRMEAEGKSVAEMVAYFKQTYGRGSPSTVYAWLNHGK